MPPVLAQPATPTSIGKSLRFYQTGTATANFVDSQWLFTTTTPSGVSGQGFSRGMRITALTAALEISFDGVNVHDKVAIGATVVYQDRCEGYIAVRGATSVFTISAW